jgi:tyrosinase
LFREKMRFTSPLAFSLIAGTLSNALPAPQDETTSILVATSTTTVIQTSALPTAASSDATTASEQIDQLAQFAQQQANATLQDNSAKRGSCNIFNVAVRREWGSLSKQERKAYTDAVLCLQAKKANTPASLVPGAKSRFDDWVSTHINQTLNIHYTGTFLAWHRYFTWQYEQALRNECGYKGYQPYWNWVRTLHAPPSFEANTDFIYTLCRPRPRPPA